MTPPKHLVTGATNGIGRFTALQLAARGALVLVHGRTEARAREAVAWLLARRRGDFVPVWGDFGSLTEVRGLADQVIALAPVLDVLINNAGVFLPERQVSADGHELTLQVNHLAPFLLTLKLRDALRAAPEARVVTVSSMAHSSGRVDLADLEGERGYDGYRAYAQTKLLNIHFTHELARRFSGTRVTTSVLHPGVIGTKLLWAGFPLAGAPAETGARTTVYCATAPNLTTGRYYVDAKEARCAAHATDVELERTLWELSERLVGEPWT